MHPESETRTYFGTGRTFVLDLVLVLGTELISVEGREHVKQLQGFVDQAEVVPEGFSGQGIVLNAAQAE